MFFNNEMDRNYTEGFPVCFRLLGKRRNGIFKNGWGVRVNGCPYSFRRGILNPDEMDPKMVAKKVLGVSKNRTEATQLRHTKWVVGIYPYLFPFQKPKGCFLEMVGFLVVSLPHRTGPIKVSALSVCIKPINHFWGLPPKKPSQTTGARE